MRCVGQLLSALFNLALLSISTTNELLHNFTMYNFTLQFSLQSSVIDQQTVAFTISKNYTVVCGLVCCMNNQENMVFQVNAKSCKLYTLRTLHSKSGRGYIRVTIAVLPYPAQSLVNPLLRATTETTTRMCGRKMHEPPGWQSPGANAALLPMPVHTKRHIHTHLFVIELAGRCKCDCRRRLNVILGAHRHRK